MSSPNSSSASNFRTSPSHRSALLFPCVLGLICLPLVFWVKGTWWVAVATLAGIGLATSPRSGQSLTLGLLACGWIELARRTANHELFFPYCIYLASLLFVCCGAGDFWRGVRWSAAVLALFFVARVWQQASLRVLVVEFIVATSIWELVMVACRPRLPVPLWQLCVPFLAMWLAYASLSL